jgi:NDP-sugar pyrophosphorylase family protein
MVQKAIILASGAAVRIGGVSARRTRAMLPIVGKPFAARIMERIRAAGIHEFVVLLGKMDGVLATYLNESWYPDAKLEFVMHTGTVASANALLSAASSVHEPCFVTTVEQILSVSDYKQVITTAQTDDRICFLYHADEPIPAGVITPLLLEKIAIQTTTHGASLPLERFIDTESLTRLEAQQVQLLNTPRDLLAINQHYLDDGIGSYILTELDASVTVTPPVRIDPGVRVGIGAAIGPYTYLETGARVGAGAIVRNSVVLNRGVVPENQKCDNLVVTKG